MTDKTTKTIRNISRSSLYVMACALLIFGINYLRDYHPPVDSGSVKYVDTGR